MPFAFARRVYTAAVPYLSAAPKLTEAVSHKWVGMLLSQRPVALRRNTTTVIRFCEGRSYDSQPSYRCTCAVPYRISRESFVACGNKPHGPWYAVYPFFVSGTSFVAGGNDANSSSAVLCCAVPFCVIVYPILLHLFPFFVSGTSLVAGGSDSFLVNGCALLPVPFFGLRKSPSSLAVMVVAGGSDSKLHDGCAVLCFMYPFLV